MEEVRSYWQVASISHFCTIFGKPFKLPTFEPEDLEQAFILDIPPPPTPTTSTSNNINNINYNSNHNHNNNLNHDDPPTPEPEEVKKQDEEEEEGQQDDDPDFKPPPQIQAQTLLHQQQQQQNPQTDEQPELPLLVRVAIPLLRPHFNCKISHANWESYLRRLIDQNWVELEHHPSPFRIPIISQDGVELTKNLTFNELPLSDKIDLFYALCDYRLWCEDAADALKDYPLEELRLESVGRDSQGYEYWYFSGTRLFRENKELSQDIMLRKKRITELEYDLVELQKNRIFREQEEKRKAELERARLIAAEAREARLVAKRQQEQEASKKRRQAAPILPPRTGLRERRSSATSNNNDSINSRTPTTRSKQAKQQPEQQQQSTQKTTRNSIKNSKYNHILQSSDDTSDKPKKSPEEECQDELKNLAITNEERAEAWSIHCESLEEWEAFAVKFEKTKSTNEKYLSSYVNAEILPIIRAIYAKRAAESRRKEKELMFSLTSRRVSTRIISRRAQEEEDERQAQIRQAEMRLKKMEAETRLRAELQREMKARKDEMLILNGGASSTCSENGEDHSGRYNLRQHSQPQQHLEAQYTTSDEFDGIIHPDKLSEFYEALELVIDTVRTSKHAWPFVDPVPDNVPGYYDLISEPMDLRKLRTKIEFREYKSLIELEKDFQLIINNCERFNGPRNVYTKMVYKLWKSFRKNVRLYLQRDLSMDEYETFIYPQEPPPQKMKKEQPEPVKEESLEYVFEEPAELVKDEPLEPMMEEPLETVIEKPLEPVMEEQLERVMGKSLEPVMETPLERVMEKSSEPITVFAKPILEEPMNEDIIIDSYDVSCPDETYFLWPDAKPV